MNIAITGATGFIGSHLTRHLAQAGHTVVPLGRSFFLPGYSRELTQKLSSCPVVINLAGAPINRRWTKNYKKELYDSRIHTTRTLVSAMDQLSTKPALFISTSAVGYYPAHGCFDESHQEKGDGFLSDLCEAWEGEARKISPDVRLAITRFGVVLSPDGGAFPSMALPCKFKTNVITGSGNQTLSWIDLKDLVRAMEFLIRQDTLSGIIHFTAPGHLTNREFAQAMDRHYSPWLTLRMPARVLSLLMGESAQVITSGQCALPGKLTAAGFRYLSPDMEAFLSQINNPAQR